MRSFISSSETAVLEPLSAEPPQSKPAGRPARPRRTRAGRVLRERILIVAVLAAGLTFATAAVRVPRVAGVQKDNYLAMKLGWRDCADCVLAGDSRVATGLSPSAMAEYRSGRRILNFGFGSARFTGTYLDAVERILDPASPRRVIVLGITPLSLLEAETDRGGFEIRRDEMKARSRVGLVILRVLRFLEPMRIEQVVDELHPAASRKPVSTRHRDGWNAYAPPETRDLALRNLAATFANKNVDPQLVESLLARVRSWSTMGIRVYAFRPPTCAETVSIEDGSSGFDESAFVRQFELAGGTWIPVDPLAYHSSDGSHIYPEAAVRLSHDIARIIERLERAAAQR